MADLVLTEEQIGEIDDILNTAADDVLEAIDAGDEGARDVVNLLVNVIGTRLKDPANRDLSVVDVIKEGYDASPDSVISWCQQ